MAYFPFMNSCISVMKIVGGVLWSLSSKKEYIAHFNGGFEKISFVLYIHLSC